MFVCVLIPDHLDRSLVPLIFWILVCPNWGETRCLCVDSRSFGYISCSWHGMILYRLGCNSCLFVAPRKDHSVCVGQPEEIST